MLLGFCWCHASAGRTGGPSRGRTGRLSPRVRGRPALRGPPVGLSSASARRSRDGGASRRERPMIGCSERGLG
ncbi:hypothetical protein B005_3237 [Nocardiopsis alba ATCC BAA-2165]|uniref:Uncharacterized protein n=1 Tax=Nocardiopsis alba (strain ATCC BAA-2165 / BE74) TaxID=1205910 RepID=J7L7X2_NOCAA|nr:hypothetical protein B005_3237 [Nocardiopsis alba ATCC BAA-2165]